MFHPYHIHNLCGSPEIYSDNKSPYIKAHRDTEWTEVKAISQRGRCHKERWRCSVQTPDNSWDNRFGP